MEDEDYKNNLNRLICKECGSPLILESLKRIESNEIKAQFICLISEHKIINNFSFDDFKRLIILI